MISRKMFRKLPFNCSTLVNTKNIHPKATIISSKSHIHPVLSSWMPFNTKHLFATSTKQDQKPPNYDHKFDEKSSYFQILGVTPNATEQQIKSAYLQMVKKYHPDLSKDENASQKFQLIQKAYEVLSDPQKRGKLKSQLNINNPEMYEAANQFKEKFKNFKRKQTVSDQWQFSYKMYKKHYEEVDAKEKAYTKFVGQGDEYWVHKDEMQPSKKVYIQQFAMIGGSIAIIVGAFYYVYH